MKKLLVITSFIFFFSSVLLISTVFGQSEKGDYKTIFGKFERHYNQGNYDSIFVMLSPDMQAHLPIATTKTFFTDVKANSGNIVHKEFMRYENTYGVYKTTFERNMMLINVSIDQNAKINGLSLKPFTSTPFTTVIKRNKTSMILPFNGSWNVVWGGDTKDLNYHVENEGQKHAFDLLILDDQGKSYKGDSNLNESYYAFGKEIIAPCDAEVVLAIDGVKDNVPGEMNSFNVGGNMVILKTINNEYLVFCHFKHHSVKVKEGQMIKQGEQLGLCGNSGHSSEAHLHFHIQHQEKMESAIGIKCFFDKINVNGQMKTDYSPIKAELISNKKTD